MRFMIMMRGAAGGEAEEGLMVDMSWQAFGYPSNQKKYEGTIRQLKMFD